MNPSKLLTLFGLGAALLLAPGSARFAHADKEHPVFNEHPGKHKGWDKDKKDKHDKHEQYETHDRRYNHVDDTRHEHLYPRTVTRTSTGYWHSHDGYPRHFHNYRRPAPIPPHQHVRREVIVRDNPRPYYKPEIRKDYKAVRDTRNEIRDGREQLRQQHTELQKDRAELRRDIRSGASKDEIRKDRKEIREDYAQIRKTREELASDRARLDSMRRK